MKDTLNSINISRASASSYNNNLLFYAKVQFDCRPFGEINQKFHLKINAILTFRPLCNPAGNRLQLTSDNVAKVAVTHANLNVDELGSISACIILRVRLNRNCNICRASYWLSIRVPTARKTQFIIHVYLRTSYLKFAYVIKC